MYADQLKAGAKYSSLCRATAISLVDFNLFTEHHHVHSHFRLCDPHHGLVLTETLDLRFVELRKADIWPVSRVRTRFEKWLRDRQSDLAEARDEGRADVARAMLAKGFDPAMISELTGLSMAEIDKLRREP